MTRTTWSPPPAGSEVVELRVGLKIRTGPDEALAIASRLIEALDGSAGLTIESRSVVSGAAVDQVVEVPEQSRRESSAPEPVLEVRVESRRVLVSGAAVPFTRLEFDLLLFFCAHPDRVLSRGTLLSEVWGAGEAVSDRRTVDVHVSKLRVKLGPRSRLITTVRGVGYRFDGSDRVRVEPRR
jgi:two-component system phosphate regulon response regulator PhoB